ncbi:hypothetical protein KSU66_20170 [Sporosarcina sp. G11-34]|nr:hypothetical protein [Sporosarcina sp. G11-34]
MKKWIRKQWWMGSVGIVLTSLVGLFPQTFATIGENLKWLFINYWSLISTAIIIILLLAILKLLLKQQKNDPSA